MCSYFWILLLWRRERCWLQGINVTQSGNQSSPGITAEAARLILCLMQFKHLSWPVHARVEASWGSSSFYFSWEVIYGRAIMCSWRFLPIWSPGPGQQVLVSRPNWGWPICRVGWMEVSSVLGHLHLSVEQQVLTEGRWAPAQRWFPDQCWLQACCVLS